MAEGLSPMPGGLAFEDGARIAIHPESDGVESFLRNAKEIQAFLTLGESNELAFSSNGITMRLGVLVVLDGVTPACFELLGALFVPRTCCI